MENSIVLFLDGLLDELFNGLFDKLFERLFDIVGGILNIIWSLLCSLIYGLIVWCFNAFNSISSLDILNTDMVSGIYQRLTMIMTIVMVFYISFEFVKYVVSPDTISDKEKGAGAFVKNVVISILLIAFVPTIFTKAFEVQKKIIDSNVISKVILGNNNFDYKSAGSNFAGDVFSAFYRVNYSNCQPHGKRPASECTAAQNKVNNVVQLFKKDLGLSGLGLALGHDLFDLRNVIQFDGLLAAFFGGFILYVLISYNLDLAARYVQITFLQIMAPVAIISNIVPQKNGMLKKWAKQCATTYLDLFIRIAILYFMILILKIYSDAFGFYNMTKNGGQINVFIYLLVVAGIMLFVQRAPKLLKELLPSDGGAASLGFGFNLKERTDQIGKTANTIMKPIAAGRGVAAGVARAAFSTKLKGLDKGISIFKAGYKGATTGAKSGRFRDATNAARGAVHEDEATVNNGGTVRGKTFKGPHYADAKNRFQVELDDTKTAVKIKGIVTSEADEIKAVKKAKAAWESAKSGGKSAAEIETLRKQYKDIQKEYIEGRTTSNDAEDLVHIRRLNSEVVRMKEVISTGERSSIPVTIEVKDIHGHTVLDASGNPQTVTKNLQDLNDKEIKENLGLIETMLNDYVKGTEESKDYMAANANADDSKASK